MGSTSSLVMPEYTWLIVVGSMAAFAFGFGTGSNDVANAFGTSVGAKTLTLKQAVLIAICFEFTGALVLGRVSTATIAGGIANISVFTRAPEIYAYGMVCALAVSAIWQVVASYFELNVSSTHSIIGSIMGFALVYGGKNGVVWALKDPTGSSFPPFKGVVPIILSWFVSPILTGIASALIFFLCRTLVLRRANPYRCALWCMPFFVALAAWVNVYFVLTKGAKKYLTANQADWTEAEAAWVAGAVAGGLFIVVACAGIPLMHYFLTKRMAAEAAERARLADAELAELPKEVAAGDGGALGGGAGSAESTSDGTVDVNRWIAMRRSMSVVWGETSKAVMHGVNVDIHACVEEDPIVAAIHHGAEVFDPKAEAAFAYLQVFSAVCVVFAHGAGEVGYMAGPLSTVYDAVSKGILFKNTVAPIWVILIGALGLVIGLATYGYNVTRAMGTKMAKLTATRGFAAELATAMVIMVAAQYGLPTSSSQCIVGGIIGVGLMEGKNGVNWSFFLKQMVSWAFTLFICAACTAALFSQAIYAPSAPMQSQLLQYENGLSSLTQSMGVSLNTSLYYYSSAASAGIPGYPLTPAAIKATSATIKNISAAIKKATSTTTQTTHSSNILGYLYSMLSVVQNNTVTSVGQARVFNGSNFAMVCNSNVTSSILANTSVACKAAALVSPALVTA